MTSRPGPHTAIESNSRDLNEMGNKGAAESSFMRGIPFVVVFVTGCLFYV
jgi:hypothetical protein